MFSFPYLVNKISMGEFCAVLTTRGLIFHEKSIDNPNVYFRSYGFLEIHRLSTFKHIWKFVIFPSGIAHLYRVYSDYTCFNLSSDILYTLYKRTIHVYYTVYTPLDFVKCTKRG